MSLSDDIIDGNIETVREQLAQPISVNYLDKYGYTPLIEAAIVNKPDIAALLIEKGAKVDLKDHTGQTALHWAVDNNSYEMTKLLLDHKANPNAYTPHGQPVLFNPILRENHELRDLLLAYGADINFAKDYINAKLIGHRFELQGYSDIVTTRGLFLGIDLEGFYLEFTLGLIRDSLEKFINSYTAARLNLPKDDLPLIVKALKNASDLRSFKHYSKDIEEHTDTIRELISLDLLLLPISYCGHAITFIKHGNLWAKCDRGVHKMTDPISIKYIGKPKALTIEFYKHLLYQPQTEKNIKFDLPNALAVEPFAKLPIKHQITGNCSWANVEASVPTMLFTLMYDRLQDKSNLIGLVKEVMHLYQVWQEWDKERALEDCLRDFKEANKNRKKAKAALLGLILFQACDAKKRMDVKRAQKIFPILMQPEYKYVLKSYVKVFLKSGKGGQNAKNFHELCKLCNIRISDIEK